jgi:hypothetical protein
MYAFVQSRLVKTPASHVNFKVLQTGSAQKGSATFGRRFLAALLAALAAPHA